MRNTTMTEFEVTVPVMLTDRGRIDYIVKANSYEEAIEQAKEGRYEAMYLKVYSSDNVEYFWEEARVAHE